MKRRSYAAALAVFAGVLASCVTLRSNEPETGPPPDTRVQVVNKGWSEMVIYADRSGSRIRLGSVTSLSTETLLIPRAVVTNGTVFRLVVAPIGSNALHTTEPVRVSPGQVLAFEIQENLALSSVSIWAQ